MSQKTTPYDVIARRWEHGWELYDGDEILTQAGTLPDATGEVQDYLATENGGEPEDYDVRVSVDLGGIETDVSEIRLHVAAAQEASVTAAEAWRELAGRLREQMGLSVRDTAFVMGVSPSRVSQLAELKAKKVAEAAPAKKTTTTAAPAKKTATRR